MQRKLAAILAADVAAAPEFMERGEAGTFDGLRLARKELIAPPNTRTAWPPFSTALRLAGLAES
jgi:hypothetical protein